MEIFGMNPGEALTLALFGCAVGWVAWRFGR